MDDTCPKCGVLKSGESCPKCGLVFAKFDESAINRETGAELTRLWEHVLEDWEDRARHALFLEQALIFGGLGYAAGRYRSKGDDPIAVEQLGRINKRLEQTLLATATEAPTQRKGRGLTMLVGILLFFAAAMALLFVLGR